MEVSSPQNSWLKWEVGIKIWVRGCGRQYLNFLNKSNTDKTDINKAFKYFFPFQDTTNDCVDTVWSVQKLFTEEEWNDLLLCFFYLLSLSPFSRLSQLLSLPSQHPLLFIYFHNHDSNLCYFGVSEYATITIELLISWVKSIRTCHYFDLEYKLQKLLKSRPYG